MKKKTHTRIFAVTVNAMKCTFQQCACPCLHIHTFIISTSSKWGLQPLFVRVYMQNWKKMPEKNGNNNMRVFMLHVMLSQCIVWPKDIFYVHLFTCMLNCPLKSATFVKWRLGLGRFVLGLGSYRSNLIQSGYFHA